MVDRLVRVLASAGLAVALVVAWVPSATAAPKPGAVFNNPTGSNARQRAVLNTFADAIRGTPDGETIQLATWRVEDPRIIDTLVAAHDRGAHVQMVVNNRPDNRLDKLRRVLNSDSDPLSFLVVCQNGCRTSRRSSLHSKFFTFTRTGGSSEVVMVSSSNLTRPHATSGWNDVYTLVGRSVTFLAYQELFEEMKLDRAVPSPYRVVPDNPFWSYYFPRPGNTKATDTIYRELSRVRCNGARGGTGNNGHTVVRVMMFHWAESRGVYLARRMLNLDNAGCDVRVIYGAPSADVVRILRRPTRHGGVKVYDSRFDENNDGVPDKYVHMKSLAISGHFGADNSSTRVYTGSQNWTTGALRKSDEVVLEVVGRGAHADYAAQFDFIRAKKTRRAFSVARQIQPLPTFSDQLPEPN